MNRLVTYGDSYTKYKWSTWADILAKVYKVDLLNRAEIGCSNNVILYRLKWDIENKVINKNDTVKIMWSQWKRYHKIIDENHFDIIDSEKRTYDENLTVYKNNADIIENAERLLIENNIDYDFLTWIPLNSLPPKHKLYQPIDWSKVLHKKIQPSMFEVVYNSNWNSREDFAITTDNFEKIPTPIIKHMQGLAKKENKSVVEIIRNHNWLNDGRSLIFWDLHSTPLHHFEYLSRIYYDLTWDHNLIEKIKNENDKVLSKFWD